MRRFIRNLYWRYLRIRQRLLIPKAYFDEKKRIKLCRTDEKMIEIKQEYKQCANLTNREIT